MMRSTKDLDETMMLSHQINQMEGKSVCLRKDQND